MGSSGPYYLTDVGGTLFFRANEPAGGYELWKSDGTEAGTVLVKDIVPGTGGSAPNNLTNVGGTLFFVAWDSTAGSELWKSDGTEAGTVLVKDINPGTVGSGASNLTNVGGTLFFTAWDSTTGYELWKSTGTAAGTVLVKDVNPGTSSSGQTSFTDANGTLYFRAYDGSSGYELWKSDGTAAGTALVQDLAPGAYSSYPTSLTYGRMTDGTGSLFFSAADSGTDGDIGLYGYELWKVDVAAPVLRTLTVTKPSAGKGTVTSTPSGINCGGTCKATYLDGTDVKLTAAAESGSVFAGWTGDCTGTAAMVSVAMWSDKACGAVFNLLVAPDVTITKTHVGDFVVGTLGSYTLTVRNIGKKPTTGAIVVRDTLPAGLTANARTGVGWTCTVKGQVVTCQTKTPLAPNKALPLLVIKVNVANAAVPGVVNEATVETTGDGNLTNNRATNPTTVKPLDKLGPVVLVTSHVSGQVVKTKSITLAGTASDATRLDNGVSSVTVNGVKALGGTAVRAGVANWHLKITLKRGLNTITVIGKDSSPAKNQTKVVLKITYTP
jgi:uncharacterized repeat protein (TIGR01451 family)